MAELIEIQSMIYDNIVKLSINIKKDSADRKTADYFKRRLSTLESYWQECQFNHDRIQTEISKTHPYFIEQQYEKIYQTYEATKNMINEQYQRLVEQVGILQEGEEAGARSRTPAGAKSKQINEETRTSGQSQQVEQMKRSQGTNSKLDDFLKRQYANFKAFIRTTSNIDVDLIADKWEFEDSLKTLHERWAAIDSLHWEIESEMDGENETYAAMYDRYEKKFNTLKKTLNTKMWSVAHRSNATPQLEIPVFSGNYNQWVSFKDLFTEAVHNNPSLSNSQKMQHLKSKIRGDAEKLIQHLQISSDNYLVCWDILNHRYDNKKLIFSSHINILLGLPSMQQQSLQQIKRMHDTTQECLNAIKNLGVNITSWDPIIVHILGQKLDSETYTDYIQSLKNSRELPILKEFLEFLETKFFSLEASRRKQEIVPQRPLNQTNYPQAFSNIRKNNYNPFNKSNNFIKQSDGNRPIAKSMHVSYFKCPLCNKQHGLYNCKNYLLMNDEQKLKTANKLKLCINCLFSHNGNPCTSTLTCRKCLAPHNTILHEAFTKYMNLSAPVSTEQSIAKQRITRNENVSKTSNASLNESSEVLLATALVKVKAADGTYYNMRALLDQGSQISLITEAAAQTLGLKRQRCKGVIFGVGQNENSCKGKVTIECSSINNDFNFKLEALIMNNLIKSLPNKTFSKPAWSYLNNINLADPEFYKSRPVDLLFGADTYANIILGGVIKGETLQQPMAQQSQLGWFLCGSIKTYHCNVALNNVEDIHKFWEVEEINESTNISVEDQECIDFYCSTTKRIENGRYEVRLPLKQDLKHNLGKSKPMAIAQLKNLEHKFNKQKDLALKYKTFMYEYAKLGHMIPENNKNIKQECYMPHHGILREESSSSSLRVVFNGSASTSSKWSLNDIMHKGPNLQKNLQVLLLQWRQFPYAFTADIEKMYRQILINSDDQQLQKIVWRQSPKQPIQSFQLTTVTYGTKAAPFLAMMTLKQLALDERDKYPEAATVLEGSFYMDDLLHGCYSIEKGKKLISDLKELLKSGGFNLRKWSSNKHQLLEQTQECNDKTIFYFKADDTSKTLGLRWNPKEDHFTFKCNFLKSTTKLTKRNLLSEISKLFDPLGWITPLSTKLKLLFQRLWKKDLMWDDLVPEDVHIEWSRLTTDIDNINNCTIPRWILSEENNIIELHGFCDASTAAYACVVYARAKNLQNITLLAAKSKLVPHKKALTLPRIELCGAHLLSKLIKLIKASLNCRLELYCWCDSMVVLGWLNGEPNRWKSFVANRVTAITSIIPAETWRYVKSSENPADAASRGLTGDQLVNHALWWNGPSWLKTFKREQEQLIYKTEEETKNKKLVHVLQHENKQYVIDYLLQQFSTFQKIVRVLAWIRRALTPIVQRKQLPSYLTLRELRNAKSAIIKHIQRTEFRSDIEKLSKNEQVASNSKLLNLKPFIDQDGVLRVGGRLKNANMSAEMKHPKIIPNKGRLAELLINEAHGLTFHGGPRLTLTTLRQQYWITSGYNTTKKQLRNCVTCRRYDTKKLYQLMGDLPAARVNQAAPFYHTGVDYTGFVDVKINKGRGVKTTKGYIVVYVCLVTKAVYLDLVSDLTSSAFLASLRRMAARRGAPRHLYSDQGTNFVGANRMLQEEYDTLCHVLSDSLLAEVAEMNIEWHFNAPSWPSAGGLWERAVQSLKWHLKRVVGEQKLTFEEYCTILAQLEACLNSRPLCSLTENIEDLDYLSPAHFLNGRVGVTVIETKEDARTRWHLTNSIFKQIWHNWKTNYLTQLTTRQKWVKPQTNMKIGDMVVIHEDNLPAGKWLMGRVIEVFPGNDGYVRVVSLKTKNCIIQRPVVKLSKLPIESAEQVDNSDYKKTQNDCSSQPTKHKQKQSRRGRLSCMVMALIFFMSLCTSDACNITELKGDRSLYFDPVTKLYLIKNTWNLVVYYNMSPYREGMKAFEKATTHLDKSCKVLEDGQCSIIVDQLIHEYKELTYYNELLMNQHLNEHYRQRRGFINGVGYLANSLFGVLDEHFAEKYSQDIELVKHNEQYLVSLWKNQTSIVESEYNLLKRTEEFMSKQHKTINKHITNLENMSNRLQQQVNNISILQEFTLMSIITTNLLHNLKGSQNILLDILTNIHHGQFNIHLLTPEQLQKELNIITGYLPEDTILPVEPQNIKNLYPLLNIKARITLQYFLFEITFPLIYQDRFKLYKVHSIPHQSGNMTIEVVPAYEYIATDLKRDSFLELTTEEVLSCNQQEEAYYCKLRTPILHLRPETKFCKIKLNSNVCKLKYSNCETKIIALTHPSLYLYHCCGTCEVKVMCGEHIALKQLNNTGRLYLEPGCLIKGSDYTLHIPKTNNNKLEIQSNIYVPIIDPINNIINSSLLNTENLNVSESKDLQNALQKLHVRIEDLENSPPVLETSLTSHDIHQYVITYIIVIVIVLATGVLLWRRRRLSANRAIISDGIELQQYSECENVNSAKAGFSARPSVVDPPHSDVNIYAKMSNKACSPIPKKNLYGL